MHEAPHLPLAAIYIPALKGDVIAELD